MLVLAPLHQFTNSNLWPEIRATNSERTLRELNCTLFDEKSMMSVIDEDLDYSRSLGNAKQSRSDLKHKNILECQTNTKSANISTVLKRISLSENNVLRVVLHFVATETKLKKLRTRSLVSD